ncbi:MAG TPA: sigma factor-like helix-turn-helix DNA-binding protein, partial [Acidimicrobiales bacterium]|nr:sigma factor-like helix-turn-helix DNA-binding protein [Acidimicrobiales bacterium]
MSDDLEAVFRREAGRCTATLIRLLGDVDLAEEAVAEAFALAAEQWPARGMPPNPGGWITTTARNRAIDRLRRESTRADRHLAAHRLHTEDMEPDHHPESADLDAFVDVVADDQLRLMFLCCHPALAADAQVALTLRLLGGLDTPEIARAFLVPEATMAQRIVRAKRKLRDNHAAYRIPREAELPDRLHSVLAAIYLIYTEGHTATSGPGLT